MELHIIIWGLPHNVCRRCPQDLSRGHPLALHIGQYGDVLRTLHWDVLRMSYFSLLRGSVEDLLRTLAGDVPNRYVMDHMGMSIGRLLRTSSRCPRYDILPSGYVLFFLFEKFFCKHFSREMGNIRSSRVAQLQKTIKTKLLG